MWVGEILPVNNTHDIDKQLTAMSVKFIIIIVFFCTNLSLPLSKQHLAVYQIINRRYLHLLTTSVNKNYQPSYWLSESNCTISALTVVNVMFVLSLENNYIPP